MENNSFKYLNGMTSTCPVTNSFRLYDPKLCAAITDTAREIMNKLLTDTASLLDKENNL